MEQQQWSKLLLSLDNMLNNVDKRVNNLDKTLENLQLELGLLSGKIPAKKKK